MWINENLLDDINVIGFIYIIKNNTNNRYYIGKKTIDKGTEYQKYWSSSQELKNDIKQLSKDSFTRTIIDVAYNQRELTYKEAKYQFIFNVLEDDKSYNKNILGKFYKKQSKI